MKVFSFLKHLFIPHSGNDYKPHFFRELSIKIILITVVFLLGISFGRYYFVNKTVLGSSIISSVLIDLANENRLAYNEKPLVRSAKLDEAAYLKAEDMATFGYFSHNSPEGVTPWHFFSLVNYKFLYAGENLAIDFTETKDVHDAWMNSKTHKANLLNVNFQEIGIATMEGVYDGNPTIFVVQMFGTPMKALAIDKNTITNPTTTERSINKNNIVDKNFSTTTVVGDVKGEASSTGLSVEPVIQVDGLLAVKNVEDGEVLGATSVYEKYSTFFERNFFYGSLYITIFYQILFIVILIALIIMIVVEIRKQHLRHVFYGLLLLLILLLFIYINNNFNF